MTMNAPEAEQQIQKARIMRGPYLQMGTDCGIVIRWATDVPVQGQVWYGTELKRLACVKSESAITKSPRRGIACNHQVKLSGLVPNQKYYYAVGTSAGVQCGTEDYFVTSPASDERPLRIWVVGDAGRGNEGAAQVRDGFLKFTGSRSPDLWLMLGDNAYDTGTEAEYQRGVFEMYPQLLRRSVLWTAIGNHDAGSANSQWQTGPYYELFTLPSCGEAGGIASGTAAYYSFDYGNVHFICLDSYGSDRSPQGKMLTWAAEDAASTDKDWTIAFWHHPPYTKGSHDSDLEIELIEMRRVLPILENAGVDLVMAGHSHSYERSYLIDGHYGFSDSFTAQMKQDAGSGREDDSGAYQLRPTPHAGTVYLVLGTSALADPVTAHPAMYKSLSVPGSLVLDVQGKRLDAAFIDADGEVQDYWTMKKLAKSGTP